MKNMLTKQNAREMMVRENNYRENNISVKQYAREIYAHVINILVKIIYSRKLYPRIIMLTNTTSHESLLSRIILSRIIYIQKFFSFIFRPNKMFPLQGGKIKQKIPLENKDKLDKTFENFKRLALAYEQYVNKAVEKVKDIEDLQYLKISNVENFENIFDNWDKFEQGMPASIKDVFRNTVTIRINGNTQTITHEDFKHMTRDIPLNVTDYPTATLEKILNNSNIKLDKVSTRVRKTKGQQFQDIVRANTVSEIVKDIVSETSQQKVHQEYFDKLIKEDAEQFYPIKSTSETLNDSDTRKNVLACYDYLVKYKKACIEGIRKTLDSYEGKLKDFLIKLAQKSQDEANYKKISTIMQSFVNYKNDPQAFLQIMVNMQSPDVLRDKMLAKINTSGLQPVGNVYTLNLDVITEQQLAKVFKLATQGIVDYINLDQGLLQQFSKQMKAIIPTDFTEIILDVFINYIMICAIKFDEDRKIKFDLTVLNTDYNVFSSDSGFGMMARVKNVLTALKNTEDDAERNAIMGADNLNSDGQLIFRLIEDINANASAKTVLGLNDNDNIGDHVTAADIVARLTANNNSLLNKILNNLPELERVLHKSSSKNRTQYILYRMIDNMIKSIYGTIILIIQAHSKENQNIYTLLGSSRRRLQGGVQGSGVQCKTDCFSAYVLLYRLHKLFVYQATKIFFRKDYTYRADANQYLGDALDNQVNPSREEAKQIYSIIQITRTSKFYDLYKCLIRSPDGVGDNFDEYFRCINALWEQVPGSTTGILSERTHNLLTQYVQELINNMIITLQTLNNPNVVDKVGVQDTFNHIESKSIDGINTFDRLTNTEEYDTRIVIEERDKIKQDDVLELYMAINYQIQKFTEVYIEQHREEYFQLQIYKDNVLQELQRYKNIWLAKTEDQKDLQAGNNVDHDKFKKQYLISIITDNTLFQSIKTGFDQYGEEFGLQYKQLKFIQLRIMHLMYSYHKQYVEKYNNIVTNADGNIVRIQDAQGDVAQNAVRAFNEYFLEAVKHLYTTTHDYVYKIFLAYNGIALDDIQRNEERSLSYRATQFIQNSEFVKMKIYMFFLEQLESKIRAAIVAGADANGQNADINDHLTTDGIPEAAFDANARTAKNLCKILIKLGVIEEYQYEEHKSTAYDKHQMPFMICFRNAAGAVFDPPKDDMKPKKILGVEGDPYRNQAWIYMIITKNFYNYFQSNNTYLKNFCVNSLEEYTNSIETLKCIPMLEIRNGEIDPSKVYNFLTEAKNAILTIYDKTNSIYTKQEIKDVIRHQLDLSLDIVPVLKDAFEKFVLPVQSYYNTLRYDLSRLNEGWFSTQEYRLHVYGLKDIEHQPLGHVKSLINKTITNAEGVDEVTTTYKNCKLLKGDIEFKRTLAQENMHKEGDYELDIVKTLNAKIAQVHNILYERYHTIPQEFREKILSNDVIRQYSELTDVMSGDTIFQLPLASVQMPFQTEITSLDLSIKDQQTVIDNMLNMNEVDRYILNTSKLTYLTSSMIRFMELTYTENGMPYSRIPRPVKIQYVKLFERLFNQQTIRNEDLPEEFKWQNLFKRAIDDGNMLDDDNVLAVSTYNGQAVGALNDATLQRIFGKDNRRAQVNWGGNGNNAELFINAINMLCRNQLKLIEALAFGVNGQNRVQGDNDNNKTIRRNGLTTLINQFTQFNLVNFLIGMTYYSHNVASQIKKGLENLYVPENGNWDNLRMVKAYNHQQVSYIKFDNSQAAYNGLVGNIDIQALHHPATNRNNNGGGVNEHYEFKFEYYAEFIQYLTNRIQQNAGRNQLQQAANVNGAQIGQAEVQARAAADGQPAVRAVGANNQLGINDDRYTQIDVEGNDKPFAVFTNQNLYRVFLTDLMKTVVLEFGDNQLINGMANQNIFNRLVSVQNPIIVPVAIPTKDSLDKQGTILQSAYAKGFIDSVSKIITDYNESRELSVIYDQKTQNIELFDQTTYTVEQTELPILYMSNILALQDDQEEITNISEERKIEIAYDLIEKIRDLQDALITVQDLQTPAVSIYNTYITACQSIVNNFMQKFEWNKFFDKNFDKKYFNLEHFLELDKVLRERNTLLTDQNQLGIENEPQAANIDVVKYKPLILVKFLKLILLKGINTLRSYDGKQLNEQVFKNFNFYVDMIASGKYNIRVGVNHNILNTQFMRLTFVKRLTSEHRIIGQDHYWIRSNAIEILKDQTRFIPSNPDSDNEYYQPDWQTVLQGQRNYRNKVAQKMLSYNEGYVRLLDNDLNVFDIRRIPYMQQYTQQPYVYNVIGHHNQQVLLANEHAIAQRLAEQLAAQLRTIPAEQAQQRVAIQQQLEAAQTILRQLADTTIAQQAQQLLQQLADQNEVAARLVEQLDTIQGIRENLQRLANQQPEQGAAEAQVQQLAQQRQEAQQFIQQLAAAEQAQQLEQQQQAAQRLVDQLTQQHVAVQQLVQQQAGEQNAVQQRQIIQQLVQQLVAKQNAIQQQQIIQRFVQQLVAVQPANELQNAAVQEVVQQLANVVQEAPAAVQAEQEAVQEAPERPAGRMVINVQNNLPSEIYMVIPQHLMDEISMNTGLTNVSTVNVSVQLTFDVSRINNDLNTNLGQIRQQHVDQQGYRRYNDLNTTGRQSYLAHYIERFYILRKTISTAMQEDGNIRNIIIELFNNFLTDPVIFTYNIATHQNKQLAHFINEFQQNNIVGHMKLFSILNLQPFHPIQLIKDNSIYQIMTIFGIYVNKYNSLFATQNLLAANNDNNTYKQLNHTTKYGQKIYVRYHTKTPEDTDYAQIHNNRKPMILYNNNNVVVYYLQQNGQDNLIQVEYANNARIETYDQLQNLINRHDMSQYGLTINNWKITTIHQDMILAAKIIAADNNNANDINDNDTVIKQFKNDNHVVYQLVKYDGILLNDDARNNIAVNVENTNKIDHLVLQIFDFIRHYNKLIQTNDATDKQGITYSQYHIMVTDENTADQVAYNSV